jgi:CARDB
MASQRWISTRRLTIAIMLLAAPGLERGVETSHTFSSYQAQPLAIHGPYDLNRYDLVGAPTPQVFVQDDAALTLSVATPGTKPEPGPRVKRGTNAVVAEMGLVEIAPKPTGKPFRPGLFAPDVQVAAGKWALLVANVGSVAFYGKDGKPLPSIIDGQPMASRSSAELFGKTQLLADINAALNLPTAFNKPELHVDQYIDFRVMYDDYRDRFWIGTEIANGKTRDRDYLKNFPEARYARRSKFIAGVSKTSDPREGFWLYWWDNVVDDGACNTIPQDTNVPATKCPGYFYAPGDAADFPHFGVSRTAFIEGTHVATGMDLDANMYQNVGIGNWTGRYGMANVVPADALAHAEHNPSGWVVYDAKIARFVGDTPVGITDFVPTVNHSLGDPGSAGFLLYPVDNDLFSVWTLTFPNGFGTPPLLQGEIFGIGPWKAGREAAQKGSTTTVSMGGGFQGAAFRNGTIYVAWTECSPWTLPDSCKDAIRLTAIDVVAGFIVTREATILAGTPPENARVSAPPLQSAWPALDVNAAGDVGLTFVTTSASIYPQAAYVMWLHGSSTHTARGILKQGEQPVTAKPGATVTPNLDHLGASADPFDDDSIWMASAFGNNQGLWEVVVGKGWGNTINPDLLLVVAKIAGGVLPPGGSSLASAEIRNVGDGDAPASRVTFYLSRDGTITSDDVIIGTADVPAIPSGEGVSIEAVVTLPPDLAPGEYFVGAIVRPIDGRVVEYDTSNNASNLAEQNPNVIVRLR